MHFLFGREAINSIMIFGFVLSELCCCAFCTLSFVLICLCDALMR